MENFSRKNHRTFIVGSSGLAGNEILRLFQISGYGQKELVGEILTPTRKELNYLDSDKVKKWLKINTPVIVVVAAGKVGGIYANMTYTSKGLEEEIKNNKR